MKLDQMINPKWQRFQESLARSLKKTFFVVGNGGELIAVHNKISPYSEIDRIPQLAESYKNFFATLPGHTVKQGPGVILHDPLDIPAGVIAMSAGFYLVIGNGISGNSSLAETGDRMKNFGVFLEDALWHGLPPYPYSEADLLEITANIEQLYVQFGRSLKESGELGQQMLLLSAVEEINKLMVKLFEPAEFDISLMLDLLASSLIILTDAEGTWAAAQQKSVPDNNALAMKGMQTDILNPLKIKEGGENKIESGGSPFDILKEIKESNPGLNIVFEKIEINDFFGSLGIINPENEYVQPVLSALVRQLVIALEVASLYGLLQERVSLLLNSIGHGVVVTNLEGNAMIVNKAAAELLLTQNIAFRIGKPLAGYGLCPEVEDALTHTLASGAVFTRNTDTLRNNDPAMDISWDMMPLRDKRGAVAGALFIFSDITEQLKFMRQARDWERKTVAAQVAASLAHEIRNPLTAAKASIQMLGKISDVSGKELIIGNIVNELDRMNRVLTEFLNVSKPKDEDNIEPVNITELIEETEFMLRSQALKNNMDLILKNLSGECTIMADSDSLKQVFLNIGKNAIEAMKTGGLLQIDVCQKDGYVSVSFRDNGPGIFREDMQNIFRPFFTTKVTGTGLGLHVSRDIVIKMGGELQISSEPGNGTLVEITIPFHR